MGITVILISCCQPCRHLTESVGHDCDGERGCLSGRNTLCSPRSATIVVSFLLQQHEACSMQTHCLHSQHCCCCTKQPSSTHLSGSGPQATSHSAAMSSAGTRTMAASSNVYFGCKTLLGTSVCTNSFCFAIAGTCKQAAEHLLVGIQLYDRLRFCACTQILPALGIQIVRAVHTRKHKTSKDLSWLLN